MQYFVAADAPVVFGGALLLLVLRKISNVLQHYVTTC
jgi:hypothetical protein